MRKFTLILSLLVAMVTTAMAQVTYTINGTPVTELNDGNYVIVGMCSHGNGPVYYSASESSNRLYRLDTATSFNDGDEVDHKYIWTLTSATTDGVTRFTLQNMASGKYFIADERKNQNFQGTATAELIAEAHTINDVEYYALKLEEDATASDAIGYIHANSPGGNPNLSYWNAYGDDGTCIKFQFFTVETEDVLTTVTYNYTFNGETIATEQYEAAVGKSYPTPTYVFPYGVSAATPDGLVEADAVKNIECTIELPFDYVTNYNDILNWYKITLRGKIVTYNSTTDKLGYNTSSEESVNDLFAFVGDPFNGFKIYNYTAGANKIMCNETAGNGTVIAAADATVEYGLWELKNNGNYVFLKRGTTNSYLHDYQGAVSYWLDNAAATDPGSAIIFTVAEYDINKVALENKIAELQSYVDNAGTTVGTYTGTEALVAAIATAQEVLDNEGSTTADYEEAYNTLNSVTLPTLNLPQAGKFYLLRCDYQNRYLYANANNEMKYYDGTYDSRSVWSFEAGSAEGTFKMKNIFTQSYVPAITSGEIALTNNGADVTLHPSTVTGAIMFTAGTDGIGIHANNGTCIGYTNGAGANHYWFEEVTGFTHNLSVTSAEWATLCLGFNTTIPENVEVYAVSKYDGSVATLSAVTGVLPANEAVLVKATEGTYPFVYTAETATIDNELEGVLYNTTLTPGTNNYYILANDATNGIGLYIIDEDPDTEGYEAFTMGANKAYLSIAGEAASNGFSFRIEGTTAIDEVEAAEAGEQVIYDLTGRRVESISAPGIYIVNGKKVVVK